MPKTTEKEKIVIACRKAWEESGRGKLLLAVSGGADSTALLLAFSKASVPVEAVHCNFNLRGMESLRDKEFVGMLCKSMGVKLHIVDFDTIKMAEKGESEEMTCRRLRYDYFSKLMEKEGFSRVATGHNADDNIETFFLNVLRGSGSRGLRGMESDSGKILRPVLHYTRKEILRFLKENNQPYVTDSSNLKSEHYRRNFLRNEVLPMLRNKWEGMDRAVATTMELQERENRIVEHFTAKALEGVEDFLPWHLIYDFPDSETLVYEFISRYGGTPSMAREMAKSASHLLPGKKWKLNADTMAIFTRKGIKIEKPLATVTPVNPEYVWTRLEGDEIDFDKIKAAPLTEAYFPQASDSYEWRPANIKMKIKSLGLEGSQPVWKVLKDAGFTPAERGAFKVLVEKATGEPVWLPGIKRSRLALVAPDAKVAYHVGK